MSINPEVFYKKPDTQPNLAERIRKEKENTLARRIGTGAAIGYGTALGVKEGIRYVDPVSKTLLDRAALKSIQIPDFYSNKDYDPKTMLGKVTKKGLGSKVARATEHFADVFLPGDVEKKDIETLLKGGSKNVSYSGYLNNVLGIENEKQLRTFMRRAGIRTAPELMRGIELEAKIARANLPRKFKERIDYVKRNGKTFVRLKKAGIFTELDRYGFIPHETSAKRAIAHERLLGRMAQVISASNIDKLNKKQVNHLGKKMTFAEAMKKDGLSKVIETDYKTLFKGHEGAISRWGATSKHNKITASLITGANNDKRAIVTAGKKDILYKATEYAMGATGKNASKKQIDNAVERYFRALTNEDIKKLPTDHSVKLQNIKGQKVYVKLTKEEIIQNLINKYKKGRTITNNKVNLNFSAANKPHFLSGGMNYSVNFFRGNQEIKVKGIKIKDRFKVFHDMLISDDFDMYRGIKPLQKNVHFNIAHSTNINTKYGKNVLQNLTGYNAQRNNIDDFSRLGTRRQFLKAVSDKNYKLAVKLGQRLFGKGAMKALRIAILKGR
tara:strand:- start:579 stop:2243 length:1665 start_codon:yes stop_codon:yes gene_type:complete